MPRTKKPEQPTVKLLIKKLRALKQPDQIVVLQGCDCLGTWDGTVEIIINDKEKGVILGR